MLDLEDVGESGAHGGSLPVGEPVVPPRRRGVPPSTLVPRLVRRLLVALGVVAGVVLAVVVAWGIDLRAHDGKVVRNVELAGRMVGGLRAAEVANVARAVAPGVSGAAITVQAPGGGFTTDAKTLGVSVSDTATARDAMDVGRTGAVPRRLLAWLRSLVAHQRAPLRVRVDRGVVYRTVRTKDPGPRTEPTEPTLRWSKGDYEVVDGKDGRGIDAADVIAGLPTAAARGAPFVVRVDRGKVAPRWSEDDVKALASRAKELVDSSFTVRAGGASARVPLSTARSWVRSSSAEDDLQLALDRDDTLDDLGRLLSDAGEPATETTFVVDGGQVRIVAGSAGTRCCGTDAVARLERRLLRPTPATAGAPPSSAPVDLPLTTRPPSLTVEEAQALGIKEPVGGFTTKHAAGEPRVTNIHRIADLLRGTVIKPGATFSVNKAVGKRTTEKGFVVAPVIENGLHAEDVGGGISQFATTLFNAAFFAGLDFGEYQSHSLKIGRYPKGREATMGYPHPDLEIENTTPYGVLIWPTYDARSITVTLYSTKYVEAVQSGQTEAPRGACTRVTTERTRTYLDGRAKVDHVFATYRPAEGVACS
jgi:vancomycin resistance protein YoaR